MEEKSFQKQAVNEEHPMWTELTARVNKLYNRSDDIRSPFARDYTRILHSMAYRRLKHKTQVFYNIGNDHICTRMEHVAHVESVSSTIALNLGLNTELTKAIAMGHDLGHAPFGHHGEGILNKLSQEYIQSAFWHEKNGLRFVDYIELLHDNYNNSQNLNLTYAVRDGIISHCGEVDENGLKPRKQGLIDLEREFIAAGQFAPATWEGCVVKLADKIAYVGRDIEDAMQLGFIGDADKQVLEQMARENDQKAINTTVIMHNLIIDVCESSSVEKGICLSDKYLAQLQQIKDFNYKTIYGNPRFNAFKQYAELVLTQLFETLYQTYDGAKSWSKIAEAKLYYPKLMSEFGGWLSKYTDNDIVPNGILKEEASHCMNSKIYGRLETQSIYAQAVIDFISGMTDRYAVEMFNELISY